jgi:hypothetical protein
MLTSEWPGTKLGDGKGDSALIRYYNINSESVKLLTEFSSSLYAWSRWADPPLPEDLGFVRSDGRTFLATISHEEDAWLELDEEELKEFIVLARENGISFQ